MRPLLFAASAWLCLHAVHAQTTAPPTPLSAAECDVYRREMSFAKSVEDRDLAAFAEHVHPGAVFLGGPEPLRGRDAVVAAWKSIVSHEAGHLRWHADEVVVGSDPRIAFSRGPATFEVLEPAKGKPRYHISVFTSVWMKDADGAWRVMYDGGSGARASDSREEAERHVMRPLRCP